MKRCPTPLVIKEMQVGVMAKYHFTSIWLAKFKNLIKPSVRENAHPQEIGWMNWYIAVIINFFLTQNKNMGYLPFTLKHKIWINLIDILLSEKSKSPKITYCIKKYLFQNNVKTTKNLKTHNFRIISIIKNARWKARDMKRGVKLMATLGWFSGVGTIWFDTDYCQVPSIYFGQWSLMYILNY